MGSYTVTVAPMGVKFGTDEGTSPVPNFIPIGATCRPCGAKNLKIGLWVTSIPARCAARNAAGNEPRLPLLRYLALFIVKVDKMQSTSSAWPP